MPRRRMTKVEDTDTVPEPPASSTPTVSARLAGLAARPMARGRRPDLNRIYFLMVTLDEVSGVPRTVLTLANQLVERHEVEIISLYRRRVTPHFHVDPRVKVTYLHDQRPILPDGSRAADAYKRASSDPGRSLREAFLDRKKSAFYPAAHRLSGLSDWLLLKHLPRLAPGVVISARPALHGALAHIAPPHLLTIAQDHLNYPIRMSGDDMQGLMHIVTHRLDALVPLTQLDAADYRERFPEATALIESIPNATSWPRAEQIPPLASRTIVSVGRLERRKGMHRVIEAFAPLAPRHPDWRLDIYGSGQEERRLRDQIDRLGIGGQVTLKGFSPDIPQVLDQAAFYAMGSVYEGFPMVLLEAMSRGLPVVSYDCPRGPSEIVRDSVNGRLVPDGDTAAFTAALEQLMTDDAARRSMAERALDDMAGFAVEAIAERWEALFERVLARRAR